MSDVEEDKPVKRKAPPKDNSRDFLDALDAFRILEVSRTGVTGVCQKR